MIQSALIPPPSAYGLPAHFSEWRRYQAEASVRAIETPRRFPTIVAPTGFGKSACAETIARYVGRSAYLTITKALQNQIVGEIVDRFDIRGRSNYECQLLSENGASGWQSRADQADMLCESCRYKDKDCEYYWRHRQAGRERHLITNYAKWLSTNEESLGSFDVLICDEVHNAPDAISSAVRVTLKAESIEEFCREEMPRLGARSIEEWRAWAARHLIRLQPRLDGLANAARLNASRMREFRDLRGLVRGLEGLSHAPSDWIEDRSSCKNPTTRTAFEPVWPRAYGEMLFRGIEKVVLLSATVRPKTLELMGIKLADADFAEYPSSFPVDRRPVYWVKTVQQRHGMSESEKMEAVQRVDQIVDYRLDRKGIIHTVSFDRARHLLRHSRHRARMMFNDSADPETKDTAAVVERFRRSGPGTVLVGPSFDTGWDFAGDSAEYQVIYKVPMLNRKASPVADARCKEDPDYDGYQAMQKIVQMSGRIMRSESDRAETLITDDAFGNWFLRSNRKHAPGWFMDAYMGQVMLPPPPPKL